MNPEVERFLSDLQQNNLSQHDIVEALRQMVHVAHPDIEEGIKYGGVVFHASSLCGGIFLSKNHVTFEFSNGYQMTDPDGLLQGPGKFRRHMKISSPPEIRASNIASFIAQMTQGSDPS